MLARKTILALLLVSSSIGVLWAKNGGKGKKADAEKLPKVLIIGDSISLGYTPILAKILEGKAVVTHCQGNAGPTIGGMRMIDKYIGDGGWDVIQFNWGLWDMYGWRYHEQDISPEAYEKRLEALVSKLEKTGAKLIWATTTPPCPAPETTMLKKFKKKVVITPEVEKKYLDAAARVMKKHHVEVNDLRAAILPKAREYSLGPDNVHYNGKGYELLAQKTAEAIEKAIKKKKKTKR